MLKNVVVYIDSMKPSGGRERVVSNLLKDWNNAYSITLLTKDEGFSFYELPKNIIAESINSPLLLDMNNRFLRIVSVCLNMFRSIRRLRKTLSDLKFDYIYTTTPLNSFETFLALKDASKKLVISEHASINSFNRFYSLMKKYVYPKAYCISVPNSMDTEIYKEWGCNAIYIPHLVTYNAVEKNALDSKTILNVGRLTADKQQSKLIEMWSKITDKKSWQLWIVGDGEEHDRLQMLIAKLGLEESVKLFPARKNIQNIYRKASFFAFSSRCEGFGMVLLEAMSFGVPCISFDCPSGPRDVIKNDENGYLIKNGDCEKYIETLEMVMSMPEVKLISMGNQAFNTVCSWDNEKILKQWDAVFK